MLAGLIVAIGIVGYYTREVLRASADTPRIMQEALASEHLVLSPDDLSAEQMNALLAVKDPASTHKGWDFAGGTMTTISQVLVSGTTSRTSSRVCPESGNR